jgi:hypothetical protein
LTLSAPPAVAVSGRQFVLGVTVTAANGAVLTDRPVTWTSSDAAAALVLPMTVGYGKAAVFVIHEREGVPVTVTATVEGRSASVRFMAVRAAPPSSALKIEVANLIEFQYPGGPGRWYYAPRLRVTEPTGKGAAIVRSVEYAIPGFGPAPSCTMQRQVDAGATIELYRELYGDFELSFHQGGGRANGSSATAVVLFTEPSGAMGQTVLTVPIVAGELPRTYTGGANDGTLSCGG